MLTHHLRTDLSINSFFGSIAVPYQGLLQLIRQCPAELGYSHPHNHNLSASWHRDHKPVSGDSKVYPQTRVSEVTTSLYLVKLTCPKCGKSTLHAEFPDHYEAWIKCSSCGFFMGMSNDEWHSMENSPNLNEKIKKKAKK